MRIGGLIIAGLAVTLLGDPASAQFRSDPVPPATYRPGLPQVMTPPPAPPVDDGSRTTEAFRQWYRAAGSPALLIFWNRELTDEAGTERVETVTAREEQRASNSKGPTAEESFTSRVSTEEKGARAVTGGKFAAVDASTDIATESAFVNAWLAAGVELVDRAAIIRKMSTVATPEERRDYQLMEAVALEQGVEYLLEVLPRASAPSPTKTVFTIKIKHLPSSVLIAQFLATGETASLPSRIVAGPRGFTRQAQPVNNSPESIGAQLAMDAMARMSR